jgi:hypothetical protein
VADVNAEPKTPLADYDDCIGLELIRRDFQVVRCRDTFNYSACQIELGAMTRAEKAALAGLFKVF